ncbi:16238_t:CDS:2, partial [Racocetra persica]
LNDKHITYDDFEEEYDNSSNKSGSNSERHVNDDNNFNALVLPYPKVDFINLPDRIEALKNKIEDITRNHDQSYYRQKAMKQINDLCFNNSHSINTQMILMTKSWHPGYYDPKGTIDYLFMILLPDTTTLLIMEDFKYRFDKARKIIEESVAYSSIFNNEEEILIDNENDSSDNTDEEE